MCFFMVDTLLPSLALAPCSHVERGGIVSTVGYSSPHGGLSGGIAHIVQWEQNLALPLPHSWQQRA